MPGSRSAAVRVVLLAALGLASCDGGHWMTRPPAPEGWAAALAEERARKDAEFRESDDSPLPPERRREFAGLDYWPPDPSYRFEGQLNRLAEPEPVTLTTTAGETRPGERIGWVGFHHEGRTLRLQVYRLLDVSVVPGREELFLPFTDLTSGRETYPAGRYLELQGRPGGPYVLDLNRAYHPLCAYGSPERFACPVTPAENRLPVAIRAGERGYASGTGPVR